MDARHVFSCYTDALNLSNRTGKRRMEFSVPECWLRDYLDSSAGVGVDLETLESEYGNTEVEEMMLFACAEGVISCEVDG